MADGRASGIIIKVHAEHEDTGRVRLSLTYAEAVAIREAIAFADFAGDLPARDPAEVEAISSLLVSLDGLIPELGSDKYDAVVSSAWAEINSSH
jgi:hypothetical protein